MDPNALEKNSARLLDEIAERVMRLSEPEWFKSLRARHRQAVRLDHVVSELGSLKVFLRELVFPLAQRLAILEMAPRLLNRVTHAQIDGLILYNGLQKEDSVVKIQEYQDALIVFRQVLLQIGSDRLELRGSELMNFWREILVLEAPFVKELWKLESRQPRNAEDAWSWFIQELSPGWGSSRYFLQKMDERLDHFWDDCLLRRQLPDADCSPGPLKTANGFWFLTEKP